MRSTTSSKVGLVQTSPVCGMVYADAVFDFVAVQEATGLDQLPVDELRVPAGDSCQLPGFSHIVRAIRFCCIGSCVRVGFCRCFDDLLLVGDDFVFGRRLQDRYAVWGDLHGGVIVEIDPPSYLEADDLGAVFARHDLWPRCCEFTSSIDGIWCALYAGALQCAINT